MNKEQNIIAMIPARIGSTRLSMKNLALINGKPLISYTIEAAKASGIFDRIVVNSDNNIFSHIAEQHNVEFYLRPAELGSSTTKSDHVVYDFLVKHPTDILAWVNPTSPLQTGDEIRKVITHFIQENFDTLITVKNERVHCIYNEMPINFKLHEVFAQTQDLTPVQTFVYSIMMWRCSAFTETFEKHGYAFFCGKVGYFPVSKETAIIIKTSEDLMLAENILKAKESGKGYEIIYDKLTEGLLET